MSEVDGFAPRERWRAGEPDVADVAVGEAQGRLRVEVVVSALGMPRRCRRPPAVWLERGEWVRWQVNYRLAGPASRGGAWRYWLDTLSLAYGPAATDAFVGTQTRHVDERAPLR
ncbi:MAG TPA: hypothetical protein VGN37_23675 [Actinocatenispora sp.]